MSERILELADRASEKERELLNHGSTVSDQFCLIFAELIVKDHAQQLVQANMSNPEYARAMDAYYEQKWAHRFD